MFNENETLFRILKSVADEGCDGTRKVDSRQLSKSLGNLDHEIVLRHIKFATESDLVIAQIFSDEAIGGPIYSADIFGVTPKGKRFIRKFRWRLLRRIKGPAKVILPLVSAVIAAIIAAIIQALL